MNKASYIAKGGLFTALSVLMIYLSSIITTNRLFFLGAASLIIPMCILILNMKYSLLVYLCSSIISLLLLGPKGTVVAYILFFGLYGVIKLYIEKQQNLMVEILLKLIYFNLVLALVYFGLQFIILNNVNINYLKYKYFILIAVEFFFLLYDYILTLFIDFIKKKFRKFKQ